MSMPKVDPVDEMLPPARLATLGLQHVLVMYAGAIAVPLIVGRALQLSPEQVALLISADLFVCGIVSLIQSFGMTKWFGVKLPVMMGVTFASVGPMVAMANAQPGVEGARIIFGAIIGAGIVAMLIAPVMGRLLRFFPPVVTGTILAIIGISLMRVGVGWAMGGPAFLAQRTDVPKLVEMVESVPTFVLGGAGLVMFGMVAATGIRILTNVDFKTNKFNLYIVAISIGAGLIPLVAPRWTQQMAHGLHPLLESGILLTSITAVVLNFYFNGGKADEAGAIEAAKTAEAH